MPDHGDIYKAPDQKDESKGKGVFVDFTTQQARTRVLRNVIGFGVVVAVLLGLASWLVYLQEKKDALPDSTEFPFQQNLYSLSGASTNAPVIVSPSVTPFTSVPRTDEIKQSRRELDPQKLSEAMAEMRIANGYVSSREWGKAEIHLKEALKILPDIGEAERMLGLVYTQKGSFDQAIAVLEKSIAEYPFNEDAYNNLAAAYMHKGRMDKAEDLLYTALSIQPNYILAQLNLGLLYLATARYQSAAEYLELSVDRVPLNSAVRNNLAVALLRIGRYEDAREHLRKVIEIEPETAATYFNVAITYVLENRFEEGMEWIRKGSEYCSPALFQLFVSDSDFGVLREHPEFKNLMNAMYPELPLPPPPGG
ncbi:MAG: tetratricopeptide repeat protein [Verrucomicrobia bacterium]|nr:tetratricopeptide repeat protein [Verrucomicrobiota bacterium]